MKLEDVKLIGVLGAGVMGGGIVQSLILFGFNVIVRDLTDEICDKAKDIIINGRFGIKGGVERGKTTQEEMDQALARLSFTTKVDDLKDCDLIIEAIGGGTDGNVEIENKPLKIQVFKELDGVVKKECVFASNTSMFTIADIAEGTERKDKFVGMHFFSPSNIMKLVEVTYTKDTSEENIKFSEDISRKMGKTPVRVKDVPGDTGFIANRIWMAVLREAEKIVEDGIAKAEDVDTAMVLGYKWPVGPFSMFGAAKVGWK